MQFIFIIFYSLCFSQALWEESRPTPLNGLSNPYQLDSTSFAAADRQGRLHALHYPVSITGLLVPYDATKNIVEKNYNNPIRKALAGIIQNNSKIDSIDDISSWLGLHNYPLDEGSGPYYIPYDPDKALERMGFSVLNFEGARGFTFSCAACHSANLFGTKIIGLTNRFPRANDLFVKGKKTLSAIDQHTFALVSGATRAEKKLLKRTKNNLRFVEAREPVQLGLDTSLAHVALSLSRREQGAYAKKTIRALRRPRSEPLRKFTADSKPGVWWNVKYKNKWLLDGSVVSGNPILTNILWNEIGRGTSLYALENWFKENQSIIDDLTTTVFSVRAPHMSDFFEEYYFNLEQAKLGQSIYKEAACYKCHGHYKKAWEIKNYPLNHWAEIYKTIEVDYPKQTKVKDVGSDPQRWQGMKSLLQLNDLAISKNNNIKIRLQKGYVPPPLVGIWARWPYFHNNSIPNLCVLFTHPDKRAKKYYAGPALDKEKDFDFNCNGYPLGKNTPAAWKSKTFLFDASRPGLSNSGHYKAFLTTEGEEKYSQQEKQALIHFLQTL